jgi:phosphate transport system protein
MPRESYQDDLDDLRSGVAGMGDLVADRLSTALDAIEGDSAAARRVVEGDAAVNERYLALEQDCIDLFALQQPVAGDLRFVAASFKILTDIERVGDLATNLAGYAQAATRSEPTAVDTQIRETGEAAHALFGEALAAYEAGDAGACHGIAERDDDIDVRCQHASERLVRSLIEREADRWDTERALDDVSRLLLTIRDLERVGDHAVNVAARTLYMVESDDTLIY